MDEGGGVGVLDAHVVESETLEESSVGDIERLGKDVHDFCFVAFFELLRGLNRVVDDIVGVNNVLSELLVWS